MPTTSTYATTNPATTRGDDDVLFEFDDKYESNVRINAGGSTIVDQLGRRWLSDESDTAAVVITGRADSSTSIIDSEIQGAPQGLWPLYQTHRDTSRSAPNLKYQISVPASGAWGLRLHFAEAFRNGAGERSFHILVNDAVAFKDVDVFAQAGGRNAALVVEMLLGELEAGVLVSIGFARGIRRKPFINGFEMLRIFGSEAALSSTTTLVTAKETPSLTTTLTTTTARTPSATPSVSNPSLSTIQTATTAPSSTSRAATTIFQQSQPTAASTKVLTGPAATTTRVAGTATGLDSGPAYLSLARVNCGGPTFTDAAGQKWEGDEEGGAQYIAEGRADSGIFQVTDPIVHADRSVWPLYQTHRDTNRPACALKYRFSVPEGGRYALRLHFCETFRGAPRQREFSVYVDGVLLVSDLDVLLEAGGQYTPVITTSTLVHKMSGEAIELTFAAGLKRKPMISGIELLHAPLSSLPPLSSTNPWSTTRVSTVPVMDEQAQSTTSATVAGSPFSVAGETTSRFETISLAPTTTASIAPSPSPTASAASPGAIGPTTSSGTQEPHSIAHEASPSRTTTVVPPATTTTSAGLQSILVRVNCGGPDFVDGDGNRWFSDEDGSYVVSGREDASSFSVINEILGAPPALWPLYQTHRDTARPACRLRYHVPISRAGTYRLRLHFAEIFRSGPGERVFSLLVDGREVANMLDVFALAKEKNRALVLETSWVHKDAGMSFEISFAAGVRRKPMLSGFELELNQGLALTSVSTAVADEELDAGTTTHVAAVTTGPALSDGGGVSNTLAETTARPTTPVIVQTTADDESSTMSVAMTGLTASSTEESLPASPTPDAELSTQKSPEGTIAADPLTGVEALMLPQVAFVFPPYVQGFHLEPCWARANFSGTYEPLAVAKTTGVHACARLCESSNACTGFQWDAGLCTLEGVEVQPNAAPACVSDEQSTFYARSTTYASDIVPSTTSPFVLVAAKNRASEEQGGGCVAQGCLGTPTVTLNRAAGETFTIFQLRCLTACEDGGSNAFTVALIEGSRDTCICGTSQSCSLRSGTICAAAVYALGSALFWASLGKPPESPPQATAFIELWSMGTGLIFSTLGSVDTTLIELRQVSHLAACESACQSAVGCHGLVYQEPRGVAGDDGVCFVLSALGRPVYVGFEMSMGLRFLLRYFSNSPQTRLASDLVESASLFDSGSVMAFKAATLPEAGASPALAFSSHITVASAAEAVAECARVCSILTPDCMVRSDGG
jgi:hypothetical protein